MGSTPAPHDAKGLASIPSMTSIQYMNSNEPYIDNKSESIKLP